MHKFDKLTVVELENLKTKTEEQIREFWGTAHSYLMDLNILDSYIAKKQPFSWPWDRAKPLEPGCYMYKQIYESSDCAKFCTVTLSANGDLMVYFNDSKSNYFMKAVGHMHWIKAPQEQE